MDYKKRLNNILSLMDKENADWFFVTYLPNVLYLSGYSGSHGILLISQENQYILTDGRYTEQVKNEVQDYEAVIQGDRKEHAAIQDIIGDVSEKTVWFEADHYTFAEYQQILDEIPIRDFVGKKNMVESLRMVKDKEEITCLKNALRVAEEAWLRVIPQIREGMTERELAHLIEHEMWVGGAAKESFESLILFSPHSSLCHGKPSNTELNKGDTILMDFGCVVDHYCSDITRMLAFGQPSREFQDMYNCVYKANQAAEEQIKAGINGPDAHIFAKEVIKQAGREKQFMHGLGHGVGMEIHEDPRLSPLSEHTLKAGNVVTVEPGVYVEGIGGVRLEDMVVIREDGCEVLNQTSKDLVIL
ncbi:M24 family metallopeptidase [bacterium]|nr:M24 family metallopeptidase [bacterium]